MPLKLSIKPGETLYVNGAIVENGDRRATLIFKNQASILRGKDIPKKEDFSSPVKKLYFTMMSLYMKSESLSSQDIQHISKALEACSVYGEAATGFLKDIRYALVRSDLYSALTSCRHLIDTQRQKKP